MAVCELPPLCSKSTPLKKKKKKKNSHHCCMSEAPPLKKATPVARQKYPLCSKSTPSQKKSPLLHVESTPSARKAPPLKKKSTPSQKKSTPSQKKRGNFGGFHLPYIIGTVPLKSGQLDSQSYSVAVLCKQSLFDLKSIPIMT